jgi:hypothetical protein
MSSTSNIHIQPKSTNPIPDQIEPKTPPFIHCLKSTINPSLPKSYQTTTISTKTKLTNEHPKPTIQILKTHKTHIPILVKTNKQTHPKK